MENQPPIQSEPEYDAALAEIERLMDARRNTPRGDALDQCVARVEAYEARHWVIDPPGAGDQRVP
jgi:HTH-type transcriptional regulator/antitoxin HigA